MNDSETAARKKLSDYKSVHQEPFHWLNKDKDLPFLQYMPFDMLHVDKIGAMNDVMTQLSKMLPNQIDGFLKSLSLCRSRSGMPGLNFNGPQMNKILKPENIEKLRNLLKESPNVVIIDYLQSLQSLYLCMVQKSLDTNYQTIINNFKKLFDKCYSLGLLNETPKVHCLYEHLQERCELMNESLYFADTSGTESCHSALNKSDLTHNLNVTHSIGEPSHLKKSIDSVVIFNGKNRFLGNSQVRKKKERSTQDKNLQHVCQDPVPQEQEDSQDHASQVLQELLSQEQAFQQLDSQEQDSQDQGIDPTENSQESDLISQEISGGTSQEKNVSTSQEMNQVELLDVILLESGLNLRRRHDTRADGNCW